MGRGGSVWGVQQPGNILHEVALQSCGNHEWDLVRGLKQPSNVLYAVAVLGCGHHAWGPSIMRLRCRAAAIWHGNDGGCGEVDVSHSHASGHAEAS